MTFHDDYELLNDAEKAGSSERDHVLVASIAKLRVALRHALRPRRGYLRDGDEPGPDDECWRTVTVEEVSAVRCDNCGRHVNGATCIPNATKRRLGLFHHCRIDAAARALDVRDAMELLRGTVLDPTRELRVVEPEPGRGVRRPP